MQAQTVPDSAQNYIPISCVRHEEGEWVLCSWCVQSQTCIHSISPFLSEQPKCILALF